MKSERIHRLNDAPVQAGQYVLYLMQSSQRLQCNLALCEAARLANETNLPLLILFHLNADYPEANYRHFKFMTDGLLECSANATKQGIGFELTVLPVNQLYTRYFKQAAAIVCDQGYLRPQREWKTKIADMVSCLVETVEDNLIVPITSASAKAEWSARTIRPKLIPKIAYFIEDAYTPFPLLKQAYPHNGNHNQATATHFLQTIARHKYLKAVDFNSGEKAALKTLANFIESKLAAYSPDRNDPSLAATSRLSPYLHFGQISPLQILQQIRTLPGTDTFTEQLLVRRELAHNFVYFTPRYDDYTALPFWCRQTLKKHQTDPRPQLYSSEELENAATSDPYWNAAMNEMRQTGYMENTMRMYWGKKIMEWSPAPQEAYNLILSLNNRYFLDGRDANSYTGVGWCFGLHDRPWPPHPVFGTVRTMTARGLIHKYDLDTYCKKFASPAK